MSGVWSHILDPSRNYCMRLPEAVFGCLASVGLSRPRSGGPRLSKVVAHPGSVSLMPALSGFNPCAALHCVSPCSAGLLYKSLGQNMSETMPWRSVCPGGATGARVGDLRGRWNCALPCLELLPPCFPQALVKLDISTGAPRSPRSLMKLGQGTC